MIKDNELRKRVRDLQILITRTSDELDIKNYGLAEDYIKEARKDIDLLRKLLEPKQK